MNAPAQAIALTPARAGEIMEAVIARGDLGQLSPVERAKYYTKVCESLGLNPLTKPFDYITLNNKLTLYALRGATDQLRQIHGVSVEELAESEREGVFIVTAKVRNKDGRTDVAKGAVNIANLKGEALANALMKAETKAKRRATLSICGLGMLDETEVADIPAPAPFLPKKDSRETYKKLQDEIRGPWPSVDALRAWGEAAKERIDVMPPDWRDILRLQYQERLVDLRQNGPDAPPTVVTSTLEDGPEAGPVEWADPPQQAEPARDDAGDIPPALDRRRKPEAKAQPKPSFSEIKDRMTRYAADMMTLSELSLYEKDVFCDAAKQYGFTDAQLATLRDIIKARAAELSTTFDPAGFRRDVEGAISGAEERTALQQVKESVLLPARGKVPDADYKWAEEQYRKRLSAILEAELQ